MKILAHLKSEEGMIDLGSVLLLLLASLLFFSGSWQHVYWIFSPRQPVFLAIDLESSTMRRLEIKGDSYTVELSSGDSEKILEQVTTWYANEQKAKQAWENPQEGIGGLSVGVFLLDLDLISFLNGPYEKSLPSDISIPSSLRCHNYKGNTYFPDDGRACVYLGYYGHWFTQIWFREEKNLMSDTEMFALIKKAAQILVEARPPTP